MNQATSASPTHHQLSIAPMLDWTDRYYRYFARLISRHTLLYTEMVTTGALLHGDQERFLAYDPIEHPVVIQLGGSDPAELAACTRLAAKRGFDQVNLNVGCPSGRVQSGRFGACLMAEPELVAECVRAMSDAAGLPVTVKHRIGIDNLDSYDFLTDFVGKVAEAGCNGFIVHARKAWLQGLSPKENREIPPLDYAVVHRLKQDFPRLEIVINGGFKSLDEVLAQLPHVDGVMIGREAYHNPWILAEVDRRIYGDPTPAPTRRQIIERLLPFIDRELARGTPLHRITRHLLGLFHGQPGGRIWRRRLSEQTWKKEASASLLLATADYITLRYGEGERSSKSNIC